MLRGIYAAASGMLANQKRLDAVANNLANASTVGYKRDTTVSHTFSEMLVVRMNDPANQDERTRQPVGRLGLGTFVSHTATRLTNGSLEETGNPLDVAIVGDGFFAVRTPRGIRYTRAGRFTQNADGTLVTPQGYEVLVNGRPVRAARGELTIRPNGQVLTGDRVLGQLTVVTSRELGALRKEGHNLWTQAGPDEATVLITPKEASGAYELRVGYLEASNVEPAMEMVEMLTIIRSYEAGQRAIRAQDETLQKAVNEVGRVG